MVLMAYHGPNAELLGNIKGVFWQFQSPIEDIDAFTIKVSILFVVDVFSLVFCGALIWYYCKINIMKALKKLQYEYWHLFAVAEAFLLLQVNVLLSNWDFFFNSFSILCNIIVLLYSRASHLHF